ncbi:hypothetical protein CEXT_494291 [Caerostris extrusa]|uniref:Uncharacterized protein n=1 Tax=Caerostris extrusa TaxID=172846 RepID=A0AAV4YDL1_CAEEX|nr:hypothetical protein CEXT_494291 [Caerostris extrusa]
MVIQVVHPFSRKSYQDVSIQPLVGDSPRGTANGRSIKSGRPSYFLSEDIDSPPLPSTNQMGRMEIYLEDEIPPCPAVLHEKNHFL